MNSIELREQRAKLAEQARKILATADADNKRSLTGEEQQEWNRMHDEIDKLKSNIDIVERQEKVDAEMRSAVNSNKFASTTSDVARKLDGNESRNELRTKAFRHYLRHGHDGLTPEMRSSIEVRSVGEGSITGFGVSEGFNIELFDNLKQWSSVEAAPITYKKTETGNNYPMMLVDDTSNTGELLAENTQTSSNSDANYTQVTLGAYMFSTKAMLYSHQAMQDIEALEDDIVRNAAIRIGRARGQYFTTGTGSGQPQGIVTAGVAGGLVVTGTTVASGGGGPTGWTTDNITDNEHTIDPAYRGLTDASGKKLCGYMFNDTVLRNTKKLKDSLGRPLWQAGLAAGDPDTINGYPYYINQFMASPAANAHSAVFAYFPGFVVRDVNEVVLLRLVERYADYLQVGYIGFVRSDARQIQTNSVAVFNNSAT